MLYLVAHYMDPQDLNILSQLADNLLNTGNSAEALKCTETVLKEVGRWGGGEVGESRRSQLNDIIIGSEIPESIDHQGRGSVQHVHV